MPDNPQTDPKQTVKIDSDAKIASTDASTTEKTGAKPADTATDGAAKSPA